MSQTIPPFWQNSAFHVLTSGLRRTHLTERRSTAR